MTEKHFVDSNIIVYAHDNSAGHKHIIAVEKIQQLWFMEAPPSISVQVMEETYSVLSRKGVKIHDLDALMEDLMRWNIIENTKEIFKQGMRIQRQCKISIWDALIIAAAKEAGSNQLLSEDLTHQRIYDGIKVINPFIKN